MLEERTEMTSGGSPFPEGRGRVVGSLLQGNLAFPDQSGVVAELPKKLLRGPTRPSGILRRADDDALEVAERLSWGGEGHCDVRPEAARRLEADQRLIGRGSGAQPNAEK